MTALTAPHQSPQAAGKVSVRTSEKKDRQHKHYHKGNGILFWMIRNQREFGQPEAYSKGDLHMGFSKEVKHKRGSSPEEEQIRRVQKHTYVQVVLCSPTCCRKRHDLSLPADLSMASTHIQIATEKNKISSPTQKAIIKFAEEIANPKWKTAETTAHRVMYHQRQVNQVQMSSLLFRRKQKHYYICGQSIIFF